MRLPFIGQFVVSALVAALIASAGSQAWGGAERVSAQGPSLELFPGWNVVLYGGVGLEPDLALNDALPVVESIWELHPRTQTWTFWSRSLPASLNSLSRLEPGGIYFVRALGLGVWTYPLVAPTPPPPEPKPPPEPEPPAPTGEWGLTFTRTTVLFEFAESITIAESGAATVSKGETETAFVVDAVSLTQIDGVLESNAFFVAWPPDTLSGCASCFQYTITITSPLGGSVTLESDGVGASGELLTLINQLTAVLIAAPG